MHSRQQSIGARCVDGSHSTLLDFFTYPINDSYLYSAYRTAWQTFAPEWKKSVFTKIKFVSKISRDNSAPITVQMAAISAIQHNDIKAAHNHAHTHTLTYAILWTQISWSPVTQREQHTNERYNHLIVTPAPQTLKAYGTRTESSASCRMIITTETRDKSTVVEIRDIPASTDTHWWWSIIHSLNKRSDNSSRSTR